MDPKLIEQMLHVTNSPFQEQYALYLEHEDDSSDDEDDYDDGYSQNLGSRYNAKKFVKPSFDMNQMMTIIIEKYKNLEREKLEKDKENKLLKQMCYQKDTQITKCKNDLTKKNEEIKSLKHSNKEKDIKLKELECKIQEKDIILKEFEKEIKKQKDIFLEPEIVEPDIVPDIVPEIVEPESVEPDIVEPLKLKSQIAENENIPDVSNIARDLSHDPDDFNYMESNNGYYNTTDDEQDDNQIDNDYDIFDEKEVEEIKDDIDNDNDDDDDNDDTNDNNNDELEVLLPRIIMRDIAPRQYNHYGKDDTMISDAGYRYYHEIILPQRINRMEQNLQEMEISNAIRNIDPNIFASFVLSLLNTFKLKQTYEIFIVYLLFCKFVIK